MSNTKYYNFIVTFMPEGCASVAALMVVDAWSRTSRSLESTNNVMLENQQRDEYQNYSKLGKGRFTVYLAGEDVIV